MLIIELVSFTLVTYLRFNGIVADRASCHINGVAHPRCVSVAECTTAVAMLKHIQQGHTEHIDELRKLQCASQSNGEYNVCCAYTAALNATGVEILSSSKCGLIENWRIVNGKQVSPGQYPWMALLGYVDPYTTVKFKCGGSLISKRYVLTAAHCVCGNENELKFVRLGEHSMNETMDCYVLGDMEFCNRHTDYNVERLIVHPSYTDNHLSYDIALIRLDTDVVMQKHISPICLPLTDISIDLNEAQQFFVAGWGSTERVKSSNDLLVALITLRHLNVCKEIFPLHLVSDNQLCVGSRSDNQDSCKGDSGGPLFFPHKLTRHRVRYIQYGIVSAGSRSCVMGQIHPAVYTNISTYMPWITRTII